MVKTWKSNYACFSSSLLWPVLQSTNQQRPLEKPLGKHFVILATHLENPSFRFKHILKLSLRDVPNLLSSSCR